MSPTSNPDPSASIDRRHFLRGALVIGAGLAAEHFPLLGKAYARGLQEWSNPRTWGGRVPGRNSVVRITKPVLLDRDVRVAGVVIKPGGALIFHPNKRVTLSSSGNVIVEGLLRMRPNGPRDRHTLSFVRVKESRFKGGGMNPLRSDVGLWVTGGLLDLRGDDKRAWAFAAGGISRGAKSIKLRGNPSGWRVGDTIVITPTIPPAKDRNHADAFDQATITGINGRTIRLSRATRFGHPSVKVGRRKQMTAEVLNLTRNVVIQGTPRGRAHIKITSHRIQNIRNVDIRYMGPREKKGDFTKKILGRWCLHFHHCHSGSRRSLVKGVVVRDSGSHAFVSHKSHGIRFSDCIAFNNLETAYWWDPPTNRDKARSNGIVYQRCVAALLQSDPPHRGGTGLMGFMMAQGLNNVARKCVAVGVLGQHFGDSSGFGWIADKSGMWKFEDCVSHNNKNLGTRFWLNTSNPHVVKGLTAYHNRVGSFNGAYGNSVDYIESTFYGNQKQAITAKATSNDSHRFVDTEFEQVGDSDYCVEFKEHVKIPSRTTVFRNCSFKGHKKAAMGFTNETEIADLVDVVDCKFEGNEFWLGDRIDPKSRIRVQHPILGTIQLSRWDQILEGDLNLDWNARVKRIQPFD